MKRFLLVVGVSVIGILLSACTNGGMNRNHGKVTGAQTGKEAGIEKDIEKEAQAEIEVQEERELQEKRNVQEEIKTDTETKIQTKIKTETAAESEPKTDIPSQTWECVERSFIYPEGMTLETRIAVPAGFGRAETETGSFGAFLRGYELKPDGSPVLLYDGRQKGNQNDHAAVFALPIENVDLQQCADSIMRVYAEYYWQSRQYGKIGFHFTDGFLCEYAKWREGYRVHVNGDKVSWSLDTAYDDSYECFVKYMRMIFNYAGTLSMDIYETETISLAELSIGDVIIKGGSPGHVVMVADVCTNENGEKAFLFAQGYMPAQEFHVIKNPLHEDDPWYYEREMSFPLETAEYVFWDESMIKRPTY